MNQKVYIPESIKRIYPYNLIHDMLLSFGGDASSVAISDIYKVYVPGVFEIMNTCLLPREIKVLTLYYKEKMTLRQVSEHVGVGPERVRQIRNKALRKIKARKKKWSCVTLETFYDAKKEASDYRLKYLILSEKMPQIEKDKMNTEELLRKSLHVPIDELELSVRSYNCLARRKVKYVDELATLTEEDLAGFRNLGRKSLDEIKYRLKEKFNVVIFENKEVRDAFFREDQEFC